MSLDALRGFDMFWIIGADGRVLFNRFYQPDIDLEALEVKPNLLLSTPMAMRLPLRWIAILYGKLDASLAATSGIHRSTDVLKQLKGSLSQKNCAAPAEFERAQYMRAISKYTPAEA